MLLNDYPATLPFLQNSCPPGVLPVGRPPVPAVHIIEHAVEPRGLTRFRESDVQVRDLMPNISESFISEDLRILLELLESPYHIVSWVYADITGIMGHHAVQQVEILVLEPPDARVYRSYGKNLVESTLWSLANRFETIDVFK